MWRVLAQQIGHPNSVTEEKTNIILAQQIGCLEILSIE